MLRVLALCLSLCFVSEAYSYGYGNFNGYQIYGVHTYGGNYYVRPLNYYHYPTRSYLRRYTISGGRVWYTF